MTHHVIRTLLRYRKDVLIQTKLSAVAWTRFFRKFKIVITGFTQIESLTSWECRRLKYGKNIALMTLPPSNIKLITDEAWVLLDEINKSHFEVHKLKPRERKALVQVKHYLQHVFGTPYDANYYAGDFLMGPNLWCWQPLCDVTYELHYSLYHFKPNTTKDLENLEKKLDEIKQTFVQYRKNMEYGILVGMVRSVEECKAGINGLTSYFRHISIKGAKGKH